MSSNTPTLKNFVDDDDLILLIKNNDNSALKYFFLNYFEGAKRYLRNFPLHIDESDEIIYEAYFVLEKKIQNGYELTYNEKYKKKCSLKSLFFSICRNQTLTYVKDRKMLVSIDGLQTLDDEGFSSFEIAEIIDDTSIEQQNYFPFPELQNPFQTSKNRKEIINGVRVILDSMTSLCKALLIKSKIEDLDLKGLSIIFQRGEGTIRNDSSKCIKNFTEKAIEKGLDKIFVKQPKN